MIRPAFLAPLLMAAGCDSTGSADGGRETGMKADSAVASADAPGIALALLQANAAGATAAASGILAVQGRCLVLEANGERTNLAFATAGTGWDESARQLRVGARSFPLGTKVEVGGASFDGDLGALRWLRQPAAECRGRLWIVSSIDRG
ncbi:MAG TPA: hypothetical protein VE891_04945 [Allosphingosinicella sp.]|nr:hypothetical protein [Allosphingosinicella sp.]